MKVNSKRLELEIKFLIKYMFKPKKEKEPNKLLISYS